MNVNVYFPNLFVVIFLPRTCRYLFRTIRRYYLPLPLGDQPIVGSIVPENNDNNNNITHLNPARCYGTCDSECCEKFDA